MDGGGSRRQSASPAAAPIDSLLQELRALGLQGGRGIKTYAGLAAAGRSGSALGQGSSHAGYSSGGKDRSGASAFFRRQNSGEQGSKQARARATPDAGSATPPSRPKARMATPDTYASPFPDDDILFQMSGLKPLRTASRTAAAAGTPGGAGHQQQRQQQAGGVHRTKSAPAAEVAGRSPPLSRAFSFAGEPSTRAQAAPQPTVLLSRAAQPAAELPAEQATAGHRQPRKLAGTGDTAEEVVPYAAVASGCGSPEAATSAGTASLLPVGGSSTDTAAEEAVQPDEAPAPGWSEELLNWMLSEKAGLLVEAQRAQRRQQELAAELERLRARGSSTEREVQRLTVERRSLLDRVQRLSAAEAEAAAGLERLSMENDALANELATSQEVCREMLAARRAARDALSEMSAQNARLLAAYVEQKGEATRLKDALHAQQRTSEARIRALEAQLLAAQAAGGAVGQLRSPPPSPPLHAGAFSATATEPAGSSPAASASSAEAQQLQSEDSEQAAYGGVDSTAATPQRTGADASPPALNKENANLAGNTSAQQGRRQHDKELWDDERSELLNLLERLQDQLSTHAEQQAAGSHQGTTPRQQATPGGGGGQAPPPSPFCQPMYGEEQAGEEGEEHASAAAHCASKERQPAAAGGRRGSRAASNLETSFAGVSGDSLPSAEASSDCAESDAVEGSSPAVVAHHMADSPLPTPHSTTRSNAPSPPSVRQPVRPADEEAPTAATSGPGAVDEGIRQQRSASASGSQKLEAFLSPPSGCRPTPTAAPAAPGSAQAEEEQQRLLQAEQRTAQLEAELARLRLANAAAEERAAHEERRRAAEAAKAAGNAAFQAQRFEEAVGHYTGGLEAGVAQEDANLAAVLHCNRAAAHHACSRFLDALADCYCAAALDASYPRVYHRRADAYWALGAYEAAAQDLAHLVQLGAGPDVAGRLADAQRRARTAQPVNHYAVLGVKPAATPGEVKQAYRALALRFHPDKAGAELGAEAAGALFKLASEAYGVLADAEQRRHHDVAALRHKYRRFYSYC